MLAPSIQQRTQNPGREPRREAPGGPLRKELRGTDYQQGRELLKPRDAARSGMKGPSMPLPHLPVIQKSFGAHDVSGVRAYVGGPAKRANQQMGSLAYASGEAVVFSAPPDVRTASHEAAHVVQQRGGLTLPGGVGQVGDRWEVHADRVADLVVQGKSAEAALDEVAARSGPAATPGPVQQKKGKKKPEQKPAPVTERQKLALAGKLMSQLGRIGVKVRPVPIDGVRHFVFVTYGKSVLRMLPTPKLHQYQLDAFLQRGAAVLLAHAHKDYDPKALRTLLQDYFDWTLTNYSVPSDAWIDAHPGQSMSHVSRKDALSRLGRHATKGGRGIELMAKIMGYGITVMTGVGGVWALKAGLTFTAVTALANGTVRGGLHIADLAGAFAKGIKETPGKLSPTQLAYMHARYCFQDRIDRFFNDSSKHSEASLKSRDLMRQILRRRFYGK